MMSTALRYLAMLLVAASVANCQGRTNASPATDAAIVQEASAALAAACAQSGPGAVVLIARGDHVVYRDARGLANLELGVPLTPDSVFRIASVT